VPYYWYNPERAKQLVKEAGYPNGLDLTLSIVARDIEQQQAEMMKQMLDAVGIRTTIEAMEQLAWASKVLKARNFHFATRRNILQPDPDRVMTQDWTVSSLPGVEIAEIAQLAAEGRASFDPQKRHQVYVRAQKIMYDSAWWGYLWLMPRNYLLNKRVRNFPKDVWATFMRERELWLAS
jgi:peptide/nickel transport system substrate-binding protein